MKTLNHFALMLIVFAAMTAGANTLTVTSTGDTGAGTLRGAVAFAVSGDTINFAANLSGQTIVLTGGQITLSQNITIDASALTNQIQINGNTNSRIFTVNSGVSVVLNSLIITNGLVSGNGGGIYNDGTLTVNNCTLAKNSANGIFGFGGGIYTDSGRTLTVNNSTLAHNICGVDGGGIYNGGTLTLNNSTLANNMCESGGGIDNDEGSTLTMNNSTLYGNQANGGGGIYNYYSTLNLTNSIICSNTASSSPNISGSYSGSNNLVDTNALLAALGNYGGPTQTMPPLPGSPAINAGGATSLTTDQRGYPRTVGSATDIGAVEFQYGLVVSSTTDSGDNSLRADVDYAPPGSTITFAPNLSGQTITLTNGQIILSNNVAIDGSALPGGIQISGNQHSRIFNVSSNGMVTLQSLTLLNGNGGGSDGGALLNAGNTVLNNCTFNANSTGSGGAIKNGNGSLTLNECTLSGNSTAGGGGGGIVNYATLALNACTLSGNSSSANFGGAIYTEVSSQVTLDNSVAAGNTGYDIYSKGTLIYAGTNIVQSISGSSSGTTPINANPQLAALGNYGGPTQTMPPLSSGSPAIDAGSDAANGFATDQRGYPRLAGAHVDIGAVEGVYVTAGPGTVTNVTRLSGGSIQFGFTNYTDANFPVLATTNVALPSGDWTRIGFATNNPAGSDNYQFTDPQATNFPQRFYRVKSP